jgi:Helix-turn-helix domain
LQGETLSWKATAFVKPITHYPDGTKVRAAEKLLLFVLADDHNDSRGYAWPSQKTLARNALLSDRQVRRLLTKILSKRWPIRIETQKKAGKFEMSSSHYFFLFPEDKMSAPVPVGEDKSKKVRTQLRPVGEDIAMSREVALNRHSEPPKEVSPMLSDQARTENQKRKDREQLTRLERILRENPNLEAAEQARIKLAIDDLKRKAA